MADHGTWKELEIPGASLLARRLGRGRVLMDPQSYGATRLLIHALRRNRTPLLELWPDAMLKLTLGDLLALAEKISDELDRRQGL